MDPTPSTTAVATATPKTLTARDPRGGARVRIPPPLIFLAAIGAGAAAQRAVPVRAPIPRWVRIAAGSALIAGALGVGAGALRLFRKTGQHPRPWLPSPELIVEGPFRYTRNPLYLGMTAITAAVGCLAGSPWITAAAPLALLGVHFTAVLPEEAYLAEQFGEPYREYQARVPRYL